MTMRILPRLGIALVVALLTAPLTSAADNAARNKGVPPVGAADFVPTPENPLGWRGDGTGCYPGATPPTQWGVWPKGVYKDLRYSLKRPSGATPGDAPALTRGIIAEWLIAGPFVGKDTNEAKTREFIADEAAVRPQEGDQAGVAAWQSYRCRGMFGGDDSALHFGVALKQWVQKYPHEQKVEADQAAYAFAYLYSPQAAKLPVRLTHANAIKIWVGGKEVHSADKGVGGYGRTVLTLDFAAGWNPILVKVVSKKGDWFFDFLIEPMTDLGATGYETKNIRWMSRIPCAGIGHPVVAKDNVFVCGENSEVLCFGKKDGKLRWMHTLTFAEAVLDEDLTNPLYQQAQPLLKDLQDANDQIATLMNAEAPADQLKKATDAKSKLNKTIWDLMKQVSKENYQGEGSAGKHSEAGYSVPAPSTDGSFVYVFNTLGMAACFDLHGKPMWIKHCHSGAGGGEHGSNFSPVLAAGKYVIGNGTALDCQTGAVAWQQDLTKCSGHHSLVRATIDGKSVIISERGNGSVLSATDGQLLATVGHPEDFRHSIPTSVVADGAIFLQRDHRFYGAKLALSGTATKLFYLDNGPSPFKQGQPTFLTGSIVCSSPLVYHGLLYAVDPFAGMEVIDVTAGKVVGEQMLDLHPVVGNHEGMYASPSLGGKYLYVIDNRGTTAVFAPGPTPKQIAKNQLWTYLWTDWMHKWGGTVTEQSSPVFDGDQAFIRSTDYLFCIGEVVK